MCAGICALLGLQAGVNYFDAVHSHVRTGYVEGAVVEKRQERREGCCD